MKMLLKATVAAAMLASLGAAQAAVVTFDGLADSPFATSMPLLGNGDEFYQSTFWIDTLSTKAGALPGDFVGAIVDGSDVANTCFSLVCPTNDATNFLASLNDGLPAFGRLDGGAVNVVQFDASFIAASGVTVPPTALLLRLEGYINGAVAAQQDFLLPGPSAGAYSFSTYYASDAFKNTNFDFVAFRGFACNAAGSCSRSLDTAQFALDNVNFVPEPNAWLMLGLVGLAAAGASSLRRRSI